MKRRHLTRDCLDCAFFQCERCADSWQDGYGCCCGRVKGDDDGDADLDDWEGEVIP